MYNYKKGLEWLNMAISDNKKRIMVTVDKDVEEKLKQYADEEKRNLSNYIAVLLDKHIEEKEKSMDQ